ncbi:hypothetical protein Pcinc_007837 [Petrolisthes cinctipes]|uniref:Uncharacterized protein n=1 Tax=Petrolisthes cinctipes TaxID=88211 RepID=A0AAE1GAC2_PETCI|nr:hypothetical protein Pcinc_007837 [Petrolisthes cinctipes]
MSCLFGMHRYVLTTDLWNDQRQEEEEEELTIETRNSGEDDHDNYDKCQLSRIHKRPRPVQHNLPPCCALPSLVVPFPPRRRAIESEIRVVVVQPSAWLHYKSMGMRCWYRSLHS